MTRPGALSPRLTLLTSDRGGSTKGRGNLLKQYIMTKTPLTALAAPLLAAALLAAPAAQGSPRHTADTGGAGAQALTAVYNPRVPGSMTFCGQEVDLDPAYMAERLDRELTAVAYTHGNTLLTLKRANRYFPLMAPILERNGVPLDMLYLACTESMLNPYALSPAKAAGLWQFMPDTGRQYGLEVNDYVDERYHPVKATEAACKYLKAAYAKYGSWESVASSYNAGMGRISNELQAQGVGSSFDLWLVEETTRYPFRILAYKLIMEQPAAYGFRLAPDQLYQPLEYEVVKVDTEVPDWRVWAREHGVTYRDLREANPWIRATYLTNKSGKVYEVNVPVKDRNLRSKLPASVYNKAWVQ